MTLISAMPELAWYGPQAPTQLPEELLGWNLIRCRNVDQIVEKATVSVVESQGFGSANAYRQFVLRQRSPVLCLVSANEVATIFSWLPEKDDLCLQESPPALLAARLGKIRMAQVMNRDALTGLQRREALFSMLRHRNEASVPADGLSLMLIDLDGFKGFNEAHGTERADDLLQCCGRLIQKNQPPALIAARTGGQEFALLLEGGEEQAGKTATEICDQVASGALGAEVPVTVSIGIATLDALQKPCNGATSLYGMAEEALFAAKANGRNQVCSYRQLQQAALTAGEDLDLMNLENKSRVLGERVTAFVNHRSRKLLRNLKQEAQTDGLTRFFTRRYLDRQLDWQMKEAARSESPMCLALVDLDHFGEINKRFGWPTGDRILTETCDLIRANLRWSDWVGRYGGEEFCLVFPETTLAQAKIACDRLRKQMADSSFYATDGTKLQVTLCIGLTQLLPNDREANDLLERVSQLTLTAKTNGRNRLRTASLQPASLEGVS